LSFVKSLLFIIVWLAKRADTKIALIIMNIFLIIFSLDKN